MIEYQIDLIDKVIGNTSFGIWDLLNAGKDPFGAAVRTNINAEEAIALLGECGVPHVSLHDLDVGLDPWVTTAPGALDKRRQELQNALAHAGVKVWMYTPCLFNHPLVRAGSVTSNDARVRAMSLQKIFYALDTAAAFNASWVTFWLGRDGAEVDALIDGPAAYARIAEAVQLAVQYIRQQGYSLKISLEPKPNEPRGDIYVSTVGTALGIIGMLPEEERKYVGVNPELLQHEAMAGLNSYHAVSQLLQANKLSFLHLGGQAPLRYDQDHPLLGGESSIKMTFYVMLAIERHKPDCMCEFDCHPFRTEANESARKEFIMGNLEALAIMRQKAREFLQHPEVTDLLQQTSSMGYGVAANPQQDFASFVKQISEQSYDATALAGQLNPQAQYLDRLVNLHLLGYLK